MAKKTLISAFILLNLFTVVFVNRPPGLVRAMDSAVAACRLPWLTTTFQQASYIDRTYAYMTGLDPTWTMFGHVRGYNWHHVIKAEYADGTAIVLPLAGQSERTFWEQYWLDFKEVKFDLNLSIDQPARRAYSLYLARLYPEHDGSPVKAIVWELHFQKVRDQAEARRLGGHLDPVAHHTVIDVFPIADGPRRGVSP